MNLEIFFDLKTDLFGFRNEKGKVVIPAKYKSATDFSEGYAVVEYDGGNVFESYIAFIDEEGKEINMDDCEQVHPFQNGLSLVKFHGEWKLIDKSFCFVSDECNFKDPKDVKISNLQMLIELVEENGVKVLNWADPALFVSEDNFNVLKTALKNHLKGLVPKIDVTKVTSEIEFTNLIQNEYNKLKDIRENKLKQVVKENKTNGRFFSMVDEMIK